MVEKVSDVLDEHTAATYPEGNVEKQTLYS
jgi:hypothetical protein